MQVLITYEKFYRNRSLASIGTYDYDTLKGPIVYEALKPEDIKFTMLKGTQEDTAVGIMNFLRKDPKLKAFTHLMDNLPIYPLLHDSKGYLLIN